MGSGKGKVRMAQGATQVVTGDVARRRKEDVLQVGEDILVDVVAWKQFVENSDLERTRLYQYYLGELGKSPQDDLGYARILNDFFADAVTIGAVVLPSPYTAGDFVLAAKDVGRNSRKRAVEMSFKGDPALTEKFFYLSHYVKRDRVMGDQSTSAMLYYMGDAAAKLIDRSKKRGLSWPVS